MSLGREVLIIKIKLDKGLSDIVSVRERDEPSLIAARFCRKHKLPQKVMRAITYMIDKNLDLLVEEEIANQSPKKSPQNLYEKSITQKAKLTEKLNSIRNSIDAEQEKSLTFKPILCQESLNIVKKTEKMLRASTTRSIKLDTPKNFRPQPIEISTARNNSQIKVNTPVVQSKPGSLIHCHSFSFQTRPLSIYQNFKDFSNNKLKSLLRN